MKTITYYDFSVIYSNPKDLKLTSEFGEEMNFNIKRKGRKSNRDKSFKKLLKSPAIKTSGTSTIFVPYNPNEICDRLKYLLQEKQASKFLNIFNEKTVAIIDKLLEYKCIFKRLHEKMLSKCNLLHEKV